MGLFAFFKLKTTTEFFSVSITTKEREKQNRNRKGARKRFNSLKATIFAIKRNENEIWPENRIHFIEKRVQREILCSKNDVHGILVPAKTIIIIENKNVELSNKIGKLIK